VVTSVWTFQILLLAARLVEILNNVLLVKAVIMDNAHALAAKLFVQLMELRHALILLRTRTIAVSVTSNALAEFVRIKSARSVQAIRIVRREDHSAAGWVQGIA
jgi:hypothetical protein